MPILEVLHFPDERLRKIARPVTNIDKNIQKIVDDMFETMYEEEGVGLAATQVNIHQQIVVMDVSESRNERIVLINPEIITESGSENSEEGCLSVPEARADVSRSEFVTVKALNEKGESFTIETGGLLAVCIQHELDHLKGKLFIDYLSPLKRNRIRSKLEKMAKQAKQG